MAYKPKTTVTEVDVDAFLDGVEHSVRREDGKTLVALMRRVTVQSGREPNYAEDFGSFAARNPSGD